MTKATISVSLPERLKDRIDSFIEEHGGYDDRSAFMADAASHELSRGYAVLRSVAGAWTDAEAERARERIEAVESRDIAEKREDADAG